MASQPTCSSIHHLLYCDVCDSVAGISGVAGDLPYTGSSFDILAEYTPKQVAALALLGSIFKKCKDEQSPDAADVCLLAFLESNASCGSWNVPRMPALNPYTIVNGKQHVNPRYEGIGAIHRAQQYEAVKSCLSDTFLRPTPYSLLEIPGFDGSNPWSWENIFLLGDVGPGAGLHASGNSWYDKFYQSSLTFTSEDLLRSYLSTLDYRTLRGVAENQRCLDFGFTKVAGGKFDSVLKSFSTERSIEVQPTINMWAQKGIATIMEHFIRSKYGVNLETQQFINRELARRGSTHEVEVATIDLKEASNRIPWALIQDALGSIPVLVDRLAKSRVENTLLPWGEYIDLRMCSTMGNGFTFALQTALFLAAVEVCFLNHHEVMHRNPRIDVAVPIGTPKLVDRWVDGSLLPNIDRFSKGAIPSFETLLINGCLKTINEVTLPKWGVFGDDIIVPTKMVPDLFFILEQVLGGCVNAAKSHSSGDFRESCGADWFKGAFVRPVYASSVATPEARVSLLNRLLEWSAYHDIVLRRTCRSLWSSLPEKHKVPLGEMETAGLRVPESLAPKLPKSRAVLKQESDLQRSALTYVSRQVRPEFRSFQGAQLVIFGPGLLLGMIKGEIVSAPKPSCSNSDGGVLRLCERSRNPKYDTRWSVTYDWNARSSHVLSISAMELAVVRNLF